MNDRQAILMLEDGRSFAGVAVGARGQAFGEVVFHTSMTGYQEITSDPSYCGQMVTFTAPQIGNYGVCELDDQAPKPALSGVVMREMSKLVSNFRATGSYPDYLVKHGVVGISEIDTRALTRHLRERGAMRGGIWSEAPAGLDLQAEVGKWPSLEGRNLTEEVTTAKPYLLAAEGKQRFRVALIDFGVKRGILNSLRQRGMEIEVLPASATAPSVLGLGVDGVVLSNGPGDPAAVESGIALARALIGQLPMLGICLGHQIMALALGAKTFKLRFGHHGGNHPVRDESSGEIWITAQNHGFAVDPETLPPEEAKVTHMSLYDKTLEGFSSRKLNLLAVQFHPEACPGPSDAAAVFERFSTLMERSSSRAPA